MAEFAGGVSYTPFFTEAMGGMADALKGRREKALDKQKNELARSAWMGDPTAMAELTSMDPELAMKVEDQAMQRKEQTQQDTMAKDTAFQEESQSIVEQIGAFPDYASAREFGQRMKDYLTERYPQRTAAKGEGPEFTEQNFNEIKTIAGQAGADKMKTIGDGYQVAHPTTGEPATAILRDDGKGNVYEELMMGAEGTSLTRLSQYDVELKKKLAESQASGKAEGEGAEGRAQTAIDAGVAAAVTIPNLNRSLALLDLVETSGLAEDINALQQYLGWEGEGTADLAELQTLLAVQMFDTLANFRGSISEGELRTAKALSTGLGKNTEANKRILRAMQQRLARAIDVAKKAATSRGDVMALEMLEIFDPYAAAEYQSEALPPAAATTKKPAPPKALDHLKANPGMIDAFVDQYGYRPEGY
jgi:hypothetical protein